MYELCRSVINRSIITTCRLLHTYKCITLLLINLPGIYFTVTNSSASLNSCHFLSFYSNIDSNMLDSINICSLQPVSGMHMHRGPLALTSDILCQWHTCSVLDLKVRTSNLFAFPA